MTDSIGVRLRQARELRRLSLQQVSETTRVRAHYLQALENDDLTAIPSAAQARGFLRIYGEFLGLDVAGLAPVPPADPLVPAPPESGSVTAPAAPSGFWAGLRRRLRRGAKPGNADLEAAALELPQEPAVASESSAGSTVGAVDRPASAEVITQVSARGTAASEKLKKNAAS